MLAKSWQSRSIYVLLCLPALDFEPRKYLIYKEKYGGEGGIRTLDLPLQINDLGANAGRMLAN